MHLNSAVHLKYDTKEYWEIQGNFLIRREAFSLPNLFKGLVNVTEPKADLKQFYSLLYIYQMSDYYSQTIIPTYSDNVHSDIDVLPEFTATQILKESRTSLFLTLIKMWHFKRSLHIAFAASESDKWTVSSFIRN